MFRERINEKVQDIKSSTKEQVTQQIKEGFVKYTILLLLLCVLIGGGIFMYRKHSKRSNK